MKEKNDSTFIKHYIPLFSVFLFGFLTFILFPFDKAFQFFVTGLVAFAYIVWGILHHKLHGDLHPKVVIEYILIGVLGLTILYSIIIRA